MSAQSSANASAPSITAAARASACPGLTRIVAARDGGLCRIRLPGGVLRSDEARSIATAAEQHASGVIDATNRANLQLRGVRAGHETALIDALLAAGLGPSTDIDSTHAAADDVRNLMLSPLAGRDPHALDDTRDLAAQLLAMLQTDARCAALSPKFALLLDGGERLATVTHPHDVWLAATGASSDQPMRQPMRYLVGLAGCPAALDHGAPDRAEAAGMTDAACRTIDANAGADLARAANASTATDNSPPQPSRALAAVPRSQVVEFIRALIASFVSLAAPDEHRMRDLLARLSPDALLDDVQTRLPFALERGPHLHRWTRTPVDTSLRFGAHPQRTPQTMYVGGQIPLGRLDASTLRALAALADGFGDSTLHLTPWQGVLLPDVADANASTVLTHMTQLGIVCDVTEPLGHVVACAGSSGCIKSHTDTKTDALQFAQKLHSATAVHLSGCTRSCASAAALPHTLLAIAPGRYDLFARDDGPPPARTQSQSHSPSPTQDRRPERTARFGTRIACNLSLSEAVALIDTATNTKTRSTP